MCLFQASGQAAFPLSGRSSAAGTGPFSPLCPAHPVTPALPFLSKYAFCKVFSVDSGRVCAKVSENSDRLRHFQNLKAASADVCNDASAVACQAPYNVRYTTLHTFAQHTGTASRHQGQQTGMACLSPCACRPLPLLLPSLSRNPVQPAPSAALPGAPSVPSSPARDNMQDGQTDGCISRKSPGMSLSLAAGRACPCRIPRKERRTFSLKTC